MKNQYCFIMVDLCLFTYLCVSVYVSVCMYMPRQVCGGQRTNSRFCFSSFLKLNLGDQVW